MGALHFLLATITGSVSELTTPTKVYEELTKEIYDLEIPTAKKDKEQLRDDFANIKQDLKKSLELYKTEKKWQNSNENNNL